MSKLYFSYSAMNAGKSTSLLQVAHNYGERDMETVLFTAALDTRKGAATIASRVGIEKPAETFSDNTDMYTCLKNILDTKSIAAVLIDEAQWLTREQVWQLAKFVDTHKIPVMCYGLRTDFKGELFPGSETLLAIADELREIRTICRCGRKACMTLRYDSSGKAVAVGPQNQVGGNESYESVCRRHWTEALEKAGPASTQNEA